MTENNNQTIWNFITDNISTINGLILLLTLIILIWYTYETRKMRKSSEESRLLLENQNTRSIEKDSKKEKLTRSYILSQIEVLVVAVTDQIKKVENFLGTLKQDKIINLEFPISVDFNTKRIRIIDPATVFEIFVLPVDNNSNHLASFNSLLRQLDLIDSIFNSFNSSFNYILEHFGDYETRWNDNMELIGDYHDTWITDLTSRNINPRDDDFLSSFIDIYHRWACIPDHLDMYIAVPNLIELLLQKARETQPNKFGERMLKPLLKCEAAYANHTNLRQIKIREYEMYKTQLEDISSKLSAIKADFNTV